jgi:hypothetical protein
LPEGLEHVFLANSNRGLFFFPLVSGCFSLSTSNLSGKKIEAIIDTDSMNDDFQSEEEQMADEEEASEVEITDDDGTSKTYDITVEKTSTVGVAGYTQHGARVFIERTHIGRYWKAKVSNASGSDFSIDRVDVTWNIMAGTKQNGR